MGKVYEALKKAEADGNIGAAASSQVEDISRRREKNGRGLDFIEYSLNAAASSDGENRNRELAQDPSIRRSLTKPNRELSVDPSRIASQLITFQTVETNAGEEYNRLAVRLMTAAAERPIKRVLVASAEHGDGRTSITLNLACALAKAQRRVLVIDTDLHRPSLLRMLGLSAELGLNDAVAKGSSPGSVLLRIQPYGFNLMPTREHVKNPAELLSSNSFAEMLNLLEEDYDFILFDSPPLLRVADSDLLIRQTHATVLVIRAGRTKSGQLGRAIAALSPEKFLGVVLNRTVES